MPPPKPDSQQQHPWEVERVAPPFSASASASNQRGSGTAPGRGEEESVADVCRARHHALPAISSTLFGGEAGSCAGNKRGRKSDGAPAARHAVISSPTQRCPCITNANDGSTHNSNSSAKNGDGGGSGARWRTANAITVSRVLQLGHGATATRTPRGICSRHSSSSGGSRTRLSPQGEGASAGVPENDAGGGRGDGAAADVVIGLLVFESLREGDVAVSSLFLQDETGE